MLGFLIEGFFQGAEKSEPFKFFFSLLFVCFDLIIFFFFSFFLFMLKNDKAVLKRRNKMKMKINFFLVIGKIGY